jgi:hypothetical protein
MTARATSWTLLMLGLFAMSSAGCDSSAQSGAGASMEELARPVEARDAEQEKKQAQAEAARKAEEERQAAAAAATAERPRKEAGRGSIGEGGYLVAIAGARRHVLNKVDDLAWTQAVQHFQAQEGRLPKDHNEFMTKVVKPLEINLGYIEEGQEFLYDPTPDEEHPWGTLYVVAKADEATVPQ